MKPQEKVVQLSSLREALGESGRETDELTRLSHLREKRILLAEDDSVVRRVLHEYLQMSGYNIVSAADGAEANDLFSREEFDLLITDLTMPIMDGFALMRAAMRLQPLTPIIILSGDGTFENAQKAIQMGAYDFVPKPVHDFASLKLCINRALERKDLLVSQKDYQQNLEKTVAEQTKELAEKNVMLEEYTVRLEDVSVSVIVSLQTALEEKDRYTAGHSMRVTRYAEGIGRELSLAENDLWLLTTAGKLHDIGKLMIELSFINKPGPLSPDEWETMKKHPIIADRILAPLPFLEETRPIIRHHHERMDGSGYPDGLSGDEVDELTQILAVADSYDAMTSNRSYRRSLTMDEALAELVDCAERFWRFEIVDAFISYLNRVYKL